MKRHYAVQDRSPVSGDVSRVRIWQEERGDGQDSAIQPM